MNENANNQDAQQSENEVSNVEDDDYACSYDDDMYGCRDDVCCCC